LKAFLLIVFLWMAAPAVNAGDVIIVDPAGPITTLSEAVRRAGPGDEIRVRPGWYLESGIIVSNSISISGEGYPVIEARDGGQILTILADGVTVEGLVLKGVATSFSDDRSAIRVERANGCVIRNNRFDDTFFGIYLARSSGCRIEDNRFEGRKAGQTKSGNGIHLWYSRDAVVSENIIEGHRDGIYLEFSRAVAVTGNKSSRNLRYGLHFMFSDSCRYEDNLFRKNDAGVAVMYSNNVEMRSNTFEENWGTSAFGLLLKDIADSRITDNVFRRNTVGIYAEGANRIEVLRNEFVENGWAVKLMANSIDSEFRHNNFLANTFDVTTNSRQSFSTFEENFWDAYRGYDLDRDGTGDVPFYPVRLFSLMVEQNEPSVILMRSLFVDLLDAAERVLPSLTPKAIVDQRPLVVSRKS
jgi:nitrous oxidase accessory protein